MFDQKNIWPFAVGVRDKVAEWAQTSGLITAVGGIRGRGNRENESYDDDMAVSRDDFAMRIQVSRRKLAKSLLAGDGAEIFVKIPCKHTRVYPACKVIDHPSVHMPQSNLRTLAMN
jgi:hypothetical protein